MPQDKSLMCFLVIRESFFFYQSVAHDQSKWRYEHFTHPIVNLLEWIHKHKNTLPPKLNMMQRLHSSALLHCALYRLSIPIGHDWKMFVLIIGFNYCLLLKRVSSIDIYEYVNEYKHWMLPKIVFQFPIVLLFHLPGNQLENNHLSILPHRLEKKIKFRRSYNINPFTTAGEVTISSSGWHSIDTHCLYILHSRIINTNTKFYLIFRSSWRKSSHLWVIFTDPTYKSITVMRRLVWSGVCLQ